MPLAEHAGGIPGLLQCLRNRHNIERQTRIGMRLGRQRAFEDTPEAMLILPGQQGGSRRRTHRAVGVEVRKPHALRGHCIEVGRLISLVAIAADVTIAKVIGHNQDEVRFLCSLSHAGQAVRAGQAQHAHAERF